MRVSNSKPAIFERIKERFPDVTDESWKRGVIMTYGDTAYCSKKLGRDEIVHEEVHFEQQKKWTPAVWWEKYLSDDAFRLEQELEAYKRQFRFMDKNYNNKEWIAMAKTFHIKALCSPQYGSVISEAEARKALGIA